MAVLFADPAMTGAATPAVAVVTICNAAVGAASAPFLARTLPGVRPEVRPEVALRPRERGAQRPVFQFFLGGRAATRPTGRSGTLNRYLNPPARARPRANLSQQIVPPSCGARGSIAARRRRAWLVLEYARILLLYHVFADSSPF